VNSGAFYFSGHQKTECVISGFMGLHLFDVIVKHSLVSAFNAKYSDAVVNSPSDNGPDDRVHAGGITT